MTRRVFLLGPTAAGKTAVSLDLATILGGEIVNFDALKVYRGMDIGTAKPSREDRERVRHHLIDILDPSESYNAGRFVRDAAAAESNLETAIYAGGTSLYYKALVYGLAEAPPADPELRARAGDPGLHAELAAVDPAAAARLHPNDHKRVIRAIEVFRATGLPLSARQTQFDSGPKLDGDAFFLSRRDDDLLSRIEARVRRQVESGLEAEVRGLMERPWSREARESVTYREMRMKIRGEITLDEAIEAMVRRNRRLTKRQRTWLNALPEVRRLDVAPDEPPKVLASRIVALL